MKKNIFAGFIAVVFLAGCGTSQGDAPNMRDPSEKLLAGQGQWSLVEDEKTADPLARNLAARASVHPQGETYSVAAIPADKLRPDEKTDPLGSMNFRVLRLERQMVDLRRDVDTLSPAIEENIQSPAAAYPVAATSSAASRIIQGVRAADHPGKTRIVLDISARGLHTAKIETGKLTLNLPDASWAGPGQARLKTSLVTGYRVEPSPAGGSIVTVSLTKPARIASDMVLPSSGGSGTRIVIDLAPE